MEQVAESEPEAFTESRGFPALGPVMGLFGLYLVTVLGGVFLANPFQQAGVPTFENPESVANVGLIFAEILVFTVVFILILRYDLGQRVLRALILTIFGYAAYITVRAVLSEVAFVGVLAPACAVGLWILLWVYPEWYVLDATAVLAGAAIIAQLGNGLGPLPVLLFLAGMALYDAYAVYVSEHMQTIGGGVGEMRVPMVYVVPQSLSFSMADLGNPFEDGEESNDADDAAETPILLGLGDAIVPGLLAVSGGQFLDAPALVPGTVLNAPALGALVGSAVGLVGLLILIYYVERAHAGLPVLNTCVVVGYLAGALSAGIPLSAAVGL